MSIRQQAWNVYNRMTTDTSGAWGMNIHQWDWVPGVGVISALEYYEAERKPNVLSFLRSWVERNKSKANGLKVINSIAPYAIFPALRRLTGEAWFEEESVRIADWLLQQAPRTREDAFEHTVTEAEVFPEQVWADTIFMAVLFLARTAGLTRNAAYAEEAVKQVLLHMRLLQDEATGVLFHGWNCDKGHHMSAARWTRANAWVVVGVPMIVEEIESLVPIDRELTERYARLAAGVRFFQHQDGLWSTVMDHPEFYRELSGGAGIACGLLKAIRTGLLPYSDSLKTSALQALQAVLPAIREDGEVMGVSGGTPVLASVESYNDVPLYPTLYGQGLVLMLLSEAIRHNRTGIKER